MAPGLYNMMNMGGYGMGSFGIGNGYNFFTNCDGTMNTNAMLGYGLANVGLNSIFNCCWGGGAGGSKAKKEDPDKAEIKSLTKEINAQLDKLKKGISEEAGLAFTVETKYQTAIDDATQAKTTATSERDSLGNKTVTVGENTKAIKDLNDADIAKLTTADKTTYNKYKQLVEDLQEGGKYDKDIKKATDAKEAREKEIEEIQTEIKRLIAKRDEIENRIQAKSDAQVLDDADGHKYQQSSQKEIENKLEFGSDGKVTWKKTHTKKVKKDGKEIDQSVDNKVSKSDIRYVIQQFKDAHALRGREAEMRQWANALKVLWDNADTDIRSDRSLQNAYNIMYEYMDK